ncbi:MAG: trypsin-like peptidase domain-containing protein [Clostridiales bacterium]|nr:trypsin-like peptidase domain-containing protein [Clostridiales bacterium]
MDNDTFEKEKTFNNETPKKTRGSAAKVIALALCCSLVGGAAGAGGVLLSGLFRVNGTEIRRSSDDSTIYLGRKDSSAVNLSYVDTEEELTPSEIYAANVNSTVGITTSVTTNCFGYRTMYAASGSGFILTSDGYIVTNYHVVEGASEIKVTTYDNTVYKAELIGCDQSNDLAILKIDAKDLTPVVLGDSDQLNVGDSVVAIGNPLGELTFSLTTGSVSALNRQITVKDTSMNLIQTDCAINSGNSGGALFNSYGEVIGITNAKYSGDSSQATVDNIGFAIPVNSVRDIITSIIEKGYIEKPYIGITVYNYTGDLTRAGSGGVVVNSVEKGSPADEAGLKSGDIITAVNGTKITETGDLSPIIAKCKDGDELTLTVSRKSGTTKITVTVKTYRESALPGSGYGVGNNRISG